MTFAAGAVSIEEVLTEADLIAEATRLVDLHPEDSTAAILVEEDLIDFSLQLCNDLSLFYTRLFNISSFLIFSMCVM